MSNVKKINWDIIRAEYVMGTDYPSFDTLAKRHGINKPLLIHKANDLDDPVNRGKPWIQQRREFVEKKQTIQETVANEEAKKSVSNLVKILNNVSLKAFQIINRELDFVNKEQKKAHEEGKPYSIRNVVRISDLAKIADTLYKLSGSESKELLVKLQLAGNQATKKGVSLQDLSDEELAEVERQMKTGGATMIDLDPSMEIGE